MNNIKNLTEHKAVKLFTDKFGTDKITRFLKVREEFREMSDAFSEYLDTGNDEHLCDEICDLQATVTHFASLFDLFQKEMLHTAMDKVVKRETDPEYKRHRKIGIVGGIGGIGKQIPFELELAMLENRLGGGKVVFIEKGSSEDIFSRMDQVKNIEMEIKGPIPILNDCKTYFEPRKSKPWDRKEINRHSKSNYKNKRRK